MGPAGGARGAVGVPLVGGPERGEGAGGAVDFAQSNVLFLFLPKCAACAMVQAELSTPLSNHFVN